MEHWNLRKFLFLFEETSFNYLYSSMKYFFNKTYWAKGCFFMKYITHWRQHKRKAKVLKVLLWWFNCGHLEKHVCFTSVYLRLKYLVHLKWGTVLLFQNKAKNPESLLFASRLCVLWWSLLISKFSPNLIIKNSSSSPSPNCYFLFLQHSLSTGFSHLPCRYVVSFTWCHLYLHFILLCV